MLSLITHMDHPIPLLDNPKSSWDIAHSRGPRGEFSYTGCSWSAIKTTSATSLFSSGPSLEHIYVRLGGAGNSRLIALIEHLLSARRFTCMISLNP